MQAETAYNVIQALPEQERARLYEMLDAERKVIKMPAKESAVWSVQECTEALIVLLNNRKKKSRMKIVK